MILSYKSNKTKSVVTNVFSNEAKLSVSNKTMTLSLNQIKSMFMNKNYTKQIDFMLEFAGKTKKSQLKKIDYSKENIFHFNYPKFKNTSEVKLSKTKEKSLFKTLTGLNTKTTTKVKKVSGSNESVKYKKGDEGIQLHDWFFIASIEFDNIVKFPPIKLGNGTIIRIAHDNRYFRLNQAFESNDPSKPPYERSFFFRINKDHIYYSATSNDMNILGVIDVKQAKEVIKAVDDTLDKEVYCFFVVDADHAEWKICNYLKEKVLDWYCFLKFILNDNNDSICFENENKDKIIIEKKIIQPIIIIPLPSPKCNENWNFTNKGSDWQCECAEGKEQSPINLVSISKNKNIDSIIQSPIKPIFRYHTIGRILDADSALDKKDIGKDIKIVYENGKLTIKNVNLGKLVTLDGTVYRAEEIVFHTPSLHTIEGESFPLEVNVIHYGISK